MIHIYMGYKKYRTYTKSLRCVVVGHGFCQGQLYEGKMFNELVSTWTTKEHFIAGIKSLNGFYALACRSGNYLFTAVDRARSIPLFYGKKSNAFYLSDCAEWVRKQLGNTKMDPLAKKEFLLTGYVTGPDTLFPDVKQLQAGEALIVKETSGQILVKLHRYDYFTYDKAPKAGMGEAIFQHNQVAVRVFRRLVKVADGRTLVIPLSGGYDSRFIALMLKKLDYDNVITFTYGRRGNKESEVSRKLAELLDLRWKFVPYTNEDWYRWFNSSERKKYSEMAGNLCSLPHIQDWPAVWQLKKNRLIPEDSIFVPGHTPMLSLIGKPLPKETNVDALFDKHYCFIKTDVVAKDVMKKRIKNHFNNWQSNFKNNLKRFYLWECTERQVKFIANSVRVYEFWGYDWYLPFWDEEYFKFCLSLNERLMESKKLFTKAIDALLYEITGQLLPRDDLNPSYTQRLKNALRPYLSKSVKTWLKRLVKNRRKTLLSEYYSHPLASWGRYSLEQYLDFKKSHASINAAGAQKFIDEMVKRG